MQQLPIKKGWLIAIVILVILTITNPTYKDFCDYKYADCAKREAYFFIFSIYRCGDNRYIAFAKNFIFLKKVE
jgi:hypothetical protein